MNPSATDDRTAAFARGLRRFLSRRAEEVSGIRGRGQAMSGPRIRVIPPAMIGLVLAIVLDFLETPAPGDHDADADH